MQKKRMMVLVDKKALGELLKALEGHPHQIREMQYSRGTRSLFFSDDPITVLIQDLATNKCKEI